jgi:hypothetical protein
MDATSDFLPAAPNYNNHAQKLWCSGSSAAWILLRVRQKFPSRNFTQPALIIISAGPIPIHHVYDESTLQKKVLCEKTPHSTVAKWIATKTLQEHDAKNEFTIWVSKFRFFIHNAAF